jgi:membrane protease YdiL (CAAX protease family)
VAIAYVVATLILGFLFAGAGLGFFIVATELLLGAITLFWTRLYRSSGALLGSRFRFGPVPLLSGLGVAVVLFATQLVIVFTAVTFRGAPPPPGSSNIPDLSGGGTETGLLIVAIVALAPLVEELFFRGLLQRSLLRWMGPAPAIALQAGVFALTHFQKLQFAALFAFGAVLGYVAHRTGRLGPGIAAHMVFNGVAVFNLVVLQ